MNYPDVVVEFSPTTDPQAPPVWEEITRYLRSFEINRGRSTELDRAEAGTATFVLDNNDGRFDPTKTDGPYWPNIRPMKRIRIRAFTPALYEPFTVGLSFLGGPDVVGGALVYIDLFAGFVEQWALNWRPEPSPTTDSTVTVRSVDAFKILAIQKGVSGLAGQSGPILQQHLVDHGWPTTDIVLDDTGVGRDINTSPDDSNAFMLGSLQEIDVSEGGLFFMSRSGKFTFYYAGHVQAHPPLVSDVWGDETSERQYQSLTIDSNDNTLWNEIQVTSPFSPGANGTASDLTSWTKYVRRGLIVSTILQVFSHMQARAYEYLLAFGLPRTRVTRMEVAVRDDVEWDAILSKDLLDRIIVRRRPYEGLPGIYQDSVIQGIDISSEHQTQWSIVWTLTATPQPNLLTLNQASFEVDTSGWIALTNCTIARTTAGQKPQLQTAVMTLTATASGNMAAETTPNTQFPVMPGRAYSAFASYYIAFPNGRTVRTDIRWRDSGGSVISTTSGSSIVEDQFTSAFMNGFRTSYVSGLAPANAAFATVTVNVLAPPAGELHRVSMMGFYAIDEQYAWTPGTG